MLNKKSLISEFNIKPKINNDFKDYDVFQDKELLLKLKDECISYILDNNSTNKIDSNIIITAIDKISKPYDLKSLERNHLYHLVDNDINGYGPLTEVINDKAVLNIMVNSPKEVYIETKDGIIRDNSISFINDKHIIKTVNKIIKETNQVLSKDNPYLSLRVLNGIVIEAIMPPISNRPIITIKKHNEEINNINELLRIGTLTPYMARYLEACILAKLNILITGPINAGKNNLLNVLANLIPAEKRIVLLEESNSLEFNRENLIKINNQETKNGYEILKKMLADYIIIDEITKDNAFDTLELMNSTKGVITLVDGKSCVDGLTNIINMIAIKNPNIRNEIISNYLKSSFDVIINIKKLSNNNRKIVSIVEVRKEKTLSLKEIFAFKNDGICLNGNIGGEFILYDFIPDTYKYIKNQGIDLIDDIFKN